MVNNHYMESSNSTPLTMLEAGSLAYRFGVVCRLVRDELLPELDPPIYQGFLTIFATTYILLPLARADEDLLSYLPPILVEAYEYRRVEMDGYVYSFPERPVSDDMLDMGILFVALCWGIEKGDNPFSHLNYLFCSSEQIGSFIKKGYKGGNNDVRNGAQVRPEFDNGQVIGHKAGHKPQELKLLALTTCEC